MHELQGFYGDKCCRINCTHRKGLCICADISCCAVNRSGVLVDIGDYIHRFFLRPAASLAALLCSATVSACFLSSVLLASSVCPFFPSVLSLCFISLDSLFLAAASCTGSNPNSLFLLDDAFEFSNPIINPFRVL
jgi:hypothetical protein